MLVIIGIVVTSLFILFMIWCIWDRKRKNNRKDMLISSIENIQKIHHKLMDQNNINMSFRFNNIPIYYINLDRSTERRQSMESQVDKYSIPNVHRVPGVDGKNLISRTKGVYPHEFGDIKYSVHNYTEEYTLGELACVMSHLLAIQKARDDGNDVAIIMEDDISFNLLPLWPINSVLDIINNAPPDWTIISMFLIDPECYNSSIDYIPFNIRQCVSSAAYIVNRKGMDNIFRDMKHNEFVLKKKECIPFPADFVIYDLSGHSYSYSKHTLFYTYNIGVMNSLIHTDHLVWHIRSSMLSLKNYASIIGDNVIVRNSTTKTIPKIIHQTWKTEYLPELYKEWSATFRKLNPGWEYKLWTDDDNEKFIRIYYPWFLKTYQGYDKHIKRVDAVRYFLLYHYGGIYVDMDFACLKSLDSLIEKHNTKAIFGYQLPTKDSSHSIANAFMASPPNHFLFEHIIHSLELTKNRDVLDSTGPGLLTEIIKKYSGTDIKVFEMPIIYTHTWNDKNACKSVEECRQKFPESYMTTFWTATWQNKTPLMYKVPRSIMGKKSRYEQLIPKKIVKILITDDDKIPVVPEYLFKCVESWLILNPEYDFVLLDNKDCEKFLQENFPEYVLRAYNMVKPYAYKCDLVRLCWLYMYGGVYTDFRHTLKVPLRDVIKRNVSFMVANDIIQSKGSKPLINSFICCVAKHPFIEKVVQIVVRNILDRIYGESPLDPTGPVALGEGVSELVGQCTEFTPGVYEWNKMVYEILDHTGKVIKQDGIIIIETKPNTNDFNIDITSGNVYWQMWKNKDIYYNK